jgi:hypothetical protein
VNEIKSTAAQSQTIRGRVPIIVMMVFAAALIIAYWSLWFGGSRALLASANTQSYFTFENAFPAADCWLALLLLIGALGLALNRPWALLTGLLAGGAAIYLGCMDVLFDLENGIYLVPPGGDASAVIIEVTINVLTFALGAVGIVYFWSQRHALLRLSR